MDIRHNLADAVPTSNEARLYHTEFCCRHPLLDLRKNRKVEIRHINFHFFLANKLPRKVEKFKFLT